MPDSETLLKVVKKVLEDDDTDPDASNEVFAIHHFVQDKVYVNFSPIKPIANRFLTYDVMEQGGIGDLPNDNYDLAIHVWVKRESANAILNMKRMVTRVKELFKNKHSFLNSQGFDLKCRLIDFISAIPIEEDIKPDKLYHVPCMFKVILGNR